MDGGTIAEINKHLMVTVLIIGASRADVQAIEVILNESEYELLIAENGNMALEIFRRQKPDIILLDVEFPNKGGYQIAGQIRSLSIDKFVPIIFINALERAPALEKYFQSVGDDFIEKPFDSTILKEKISSFERAGVFHKTSGSVDRELQRYKNRTQHEMTVAEHLFNTIIGRGESSEGVMRSWVSSMWQFNGDLLLFAHTPAGGVNIMLGDFTGHGLPAAIGALPVTDIFYGMTAKGFSIGDIAEELNRKLHAILPTSMFCAACLMEMDEPRSALGIWNGGMPDVYVLKKSGEIRRIASCAQALGVMSEEKFNRELEIIPLESGEHIYMLSDGLIDAKNQQGEKYGSHRFESHLNHPSDKEDLFQNVVVDVQNHVGANKQNDDISFVEILADRAVDDWAGGERLSQRVSGTPASWELNLFLEEDILRSTNPVPLILNFITQLKISVGHKERIFTVLTELFTNAMDHGLLKLNSSMKKHTAGFMEYYNLREERLSQLEKAWIKFSLKSASGGQGGVLIIKVEDSGEGFDMEATIHLLEHSPEYSGRGIQLVNSLCDVVSYNSRGNCVEASYRW